MFRQRVRSASSPRSLLRRICGVGGTNQLRAVGVRYMQTKYVLNRHPQIVLSAIARDKCLQISRRFEEILPSVSNTPGSVRTCSPTKLPTRRHTQTNNPSYCCCNTSMSINSIREISKDPHRWRSNRPQHSKPPCYVCHKRKCGYSTARHIRALIQRPPQANRGFRVTLQQHEKITITTVCATWRGAKDQITPKYNMHCGQSPRWCSASLVNPLAATSGVHSQWG